MKKRIRQDDIRLGQSLINQLSSLNESNKETIIQKIFYMEDDEFCQLIGVSYNSLFTNESSIYNFFNGIK